MSLKSPKRKIKDTTISCINICHHHTIENSPHIVQKLEICLLQETTFLLYTITIMSFHKKLTSYHSIQVHQNQHILSYIQKEVTLSSKVTKRPKKQKGPSCPQIKRTIKTERYHVSETPLILKEY